MARKSRGARRRATNRALRHVTAPVVEAGAADGVEIRPGGIKPLTDPELHPLDDLADTHGDKRPARTRLADRLNSATSEADHKTFDVHIPLRFVGWLEDYAKRHGTDVSGVLDFAMRQIWRDDPVRIGEGGGSTMRKADFDAMQQ